MTKKLSLDGKVDPTFERSAGAALRAGFSKVELTGDAPVVKKAKKAVETRDRFATGATPSQLCDDKGSSASSVRQRERSKAGGVPVHELLAQVGKENDPCPHGFEDDLEELARRDRELLDEQYQPAPKADLAGQLLQDAVIDAFHDSMEATAEELGRRNFVREEDLWHERNVRDVNDGVDRDIADRRRGEQIAIDRANADRLSAERTALERRLDDDRNRR
jgi:hypothetical protein